MKFIVTRFAITWQISVLDQTFLFTMIIGSPNSRIQLRQVAGERIYVSTHATISIEHERSEDSEEIEFQLKWTQ